MTKIDLALARIARPPPDRREAIATELKFLLDGEEPGESLLTDQQWAEVQRRLQKRMTPFFRTRISCARSKRRAIESRLAGKRTR